MARHPKQVATLVLVLATAVLGAWFCARLQRAPAPAEVTGTTPSTNAPAADSVKPAASQAAAARLEILAVTLRDPAATNRAGLLTEAARELSALPREIASAAVVRLLAARTDAPTGAGFKVGKDGLLEQPPTLRVFLLDQLARLDPAAAAAYAEKILASPDSPDEWAVALRNYARVQTTDAGKAYLRERVLTLLKHEPWRTEPSVGYLEAFDVAVFSGGPEVSKALTDLVRLKDNRAVAHAAFLALDRISQREPAALFNLLGTQPELMDGREVTRANYLARADVRDAAQRAAVEGYLLGARTTPQELDTFAGLFPNANYMISNNLLTQNATPTGAELAERDRAALATVDAWLADPRFAAQRPRLEKLRTRLQTFVSQAQAQGQK
jgi:hypothetical protein